MSAGTTNLAGNLTTAGKVYVTGAANPVLNITGNLTSSNAGGARALHIAETAGTTGTVNVSGSGILTLSGGGMMLGDNNGGNGTFNQSSGTVTINGNTSWLAGANSTLNVSGGNFSTGGQTIYVGGSTSANTTSTITVNGTGTLSAGLLQFNFQQANGTTSVINIGDGSGAFLIVQVGSGGKDYVVPIDFTGRKDIFIPLGEVARTTGRWGIRYHARGAGYGQFGAVSMGFCRIPANTKAKVLVENLRLVGNTPSSIKNPVIHAGAGTLSIKGEVKTDQYLWYQGGNKVGVYDLDWHLQANLPVELKDYEIDHGFNELWIDGEASNPAPWFDVQFITKGDVILLKK